MFRGAYTLWSTNATKVYVNLDVADVESFKQRRTISQLLQSVWDATGKDNTYTCKASITKIIDDYGWYNMSCKTCRKKVKINDKKMWCHSCNTEVLYPMPRYMLRMKVQDVTGSATFVAFDKEVERLIVQPAIDLLEIHESENGLEKVSAILNDLVDYERVFQNKLNDNMQQGSQNFTVTKIFPVKIMLECKYADEQFLQATKEDVEESALYNDYPNKKACKEMTMKVTNENDGEPAAPSDENDGEPAAPSDDCPNKKDSMEASHKVTKQHDEDLQGN